MPSNIGTIDRLIRGVLGIILVGLAVFGQMTGLWSWVVPLAGVVLLVTSSLRFCPAYKLVGLSTSGETDH